MTFPIRLPRITFFDIDRFTSFEGNTGPYILYTIVRIKSILNRFAEEGGNLEAGTILDPVNDSQKNLMLQLTGFGATVENAFEEKAPHKICAYIYEVSNAFNSFYHETKILSEENEAQKASFIQLLKLTKKVLETCIDLLGFSAPDRNVKNKNSAIKSTCWYPKPCFTYICKMGAFSKKKRKCAIMYFI